MNKSRTVVVFVALAVLLSAAAGCSLGVRKAGSVITGKKGSVGVIAGHNKAFTEYKQITVTSFTSDFAEGETLLGKLHTEAIKQLKEKKLFDNVDGTDDGFCADMLVVRGRIIVYNQGNKLQRIVTLGGEAFVFVRFRIENAKGELLAEFNSRGFVKDAIDGGEIADAVPLICSGLVEFLEERIERKE